MLQRFFSLASVMILSGFLLPGKCSRAEMNLLFQPESWRFTYGPEFPGATGKLSFPTPGVIRLDGDFTRGGRYVQAELSMPARFPEAEALCFEVRTTARRLELRYTDSTFQTHQASLPLSGDDSKFQTVTFNLKSSGHSWGGANDRIFHAPMTGFGVLFHRTNLQSDTGSCEFRNFSLQGVSRKAIVPINYRLPKPEECYIAPKANALVKLHLTLAPHSLTSEQLYYEYCDYTGEKCASGTAAFDENTRLLMIPAPSAIGYYDLRFPKLGIETAVVVSEPPRELPDEFFGMDVAFSRKDYIGADLIRSHLKALRRNGIGWNRDRFSWGDVHPERDKIDFNGRNGRYELLRKIAGEEGVKILDTFHDTPQWNKQLLSAKDNFLYGVGGNEYQYGSNIYPRDLCAGAASWSAICRHWPQIAALEVWNEPETNFGNSFPPEFFIAFTKAVSSRFSLDGIQTPVVGGVLANPRAGTDYYRMLIEGGLLNDCDILSFHSYETVEYHENQIVFMRNIERKCAPDRAGIPYWISESGKPWPRGTARALIDDDRYSASEIVGKAIEFRALGVAKYFPFCYFWGEETINNFGMLDNHGAPMRSMAAYGNCALQLAHKDYIGDLLIPGTVRSRVFSDGKESIACLYVPLKMPRRLQLPKGLKVEKVTGLDGRNLAMNDREIPLEDGIVYLHFKGEPQKKFLNRNTKAMKCYALAQSYHSTPRSARPVIIQPDYNLTETAYERMGILLAPGRAFEVKLYWNNLSDHQRKVVPQIRLCRGMTSPDFSTKTLMIPANSRVEMRFTLIGDHPLAVDKWSSVVVSDKLGGATPMQMQFTLLPKATAKSGDKVLISDWFSWQGNAKRADIQADFTATYSVNTLNLHIEVRDKSHSCDFSAERAWHGDSVQVALWGGSRYSSEFCIAASQEGVKVHRHRPISKYGIAKNVKFHFSRQNGKSVYDLEFPASEFDVKELHAGQELGLSVVVNSSSGNGRNGYLQWGEGITADRKNPNLFNRLVLR